MPKVKIQPQIDIRFQRTQRQKFLIYMYNIVTAAYFWSAFFLLPQQITIS